MVSLHTDNAQNINFSIKDFFSKCHQIRREQQISSPLLKKYLMENLFFCAVWPLFAWRTHQVSSNRECYIPYISILISAGNYCATFGTIQVVRMQNFPKNYYFLPPDTRAYMHQVVRNISFSGNLAHVLNEWSIFTTGRKRKTSVLISIART